jgi:hypothetical protein
MMSSTMGGMTVRIGREKLTWIALAIVLMVVACGPSATQTPPAPTATVVPPTPTPAPTATTAPPTQTLAATATTALTFPVGATFTKVGYTMEFKADGTAHTESRWVDIDGVYTVTGDQIAMQDDYASCKDIVGTYTWTYDGAELSFTTIDDKCRDRKNVVEWGTWLKKP